MAAEGDVLADRYRLVRLIGRGPHGDVFEAEQIGLARKVAVKIVTSDLDRNRLAREAKNAAKLDPRFVVPVLESRMDHDPPFVVSELARGKSLASMVGRPMIEERVVPIVRALLDALAHAHAQSLFHGDLRPSNIFVERNGVQISDFGFAMEDTEEGRSATDLLSAKSVVGYRAPERIRGAAPDARSDIFAVGVCLYEMIAGKRPFAGGAPVDEVASILGKPPAPIRARCGPVLARALAKDPKRRFASADEMRVALGRRKPWPYVVATAIALPMAIAVWAALTVARVDARRGSDVPVSASLAPPVASMSAAAAPAPEPVTTETASAAVPASSPKPRKPSRVIVAFDDPACPLDSVDRSTITSHRLELEGCVAEYDATEGERFKAVFGDELMSPANIYPAGQNQSPGLWKCMASVGLKIRLNQAHGGCYFNLIVR